MKTFVVALFAACCMVPVASGQPRGFYYRGPMPGVSPYMGGPIMVMPPHPYGGIWNRHQLRAAQRYYSYYGGGYGYAPNLPAYGYGGYGVGGPRVGYGYPGPVYRVGRDWDNYREELEDRREDYEDWLEDQREEHEERLEDAREAREDRIENYREYREEYRERQREAWEKWRERFDD